jgi:hypothetical protein
MPPRRAFSALSTRSSISGSLQQVFQLLDFVDGKSAVVGGIIMGRFLGDGGFSRLGLKTVENHLNGPRGTFASCFPSQLGEFIRRAMSAQGFREGMAAFRAALGIAAEAFAKA